MKNSKPGSQLPESQIPESKDQDKKINSVDNTVYSISGLILKTLNNNNNAEDEDFKKILKYISLGFREFIIGTDNANGKNNITDIAVFAKYTQQIPLNYCIIENENDKSSKILDNATDTECNFDSILNQSIFKKKLNKYFPIHFPVLLEVIQKEIYNVYETKGIDHDGFLENREYQNIMENVFKKYFYIIFIFGEKIKIGEFKKILSMNMYELSFIYNSVSTTLKNINKDESVSIDSIKKNMNNSLEQLDKKNIKTQINDHFIDSLYRNIFRKIATYGNDMNINAVLEGVPLAIENLYKIEFKKIFIIFEKWILSDGREGENLIKIEYIIKKILYGIHILKKSNVAFSHFVDSYLENSNLNTDSDLTNSKLEKDSFINEVFNELSSECNDTTSNDGVESDHKKLFKSFIGLIFTEDSKSKYKAFIDGIHITKNKMAHSKVPEFIDSDEEINLNTIDFDQWNRTTENIKYEHIFGEIIGNNGQFKISHHLNLLHLDDERLRLFIQVYFKKTKKEDIDFTFEIVKNQFREILELANEGISIRDFILDDINNLNLILIWWRFILKIKTLEQNGEEINFDNINNIYENAYGVIEKISKELLLNGVLKSDITINPIGRLNNISIETISEQLNNIINDFKKGAMDFTIDTWSLESGGEVKNEPIDIKQITGLYIPSELMCKDNFISTKDEMERINNWMNLGIDLCYKLIRRENNLSIEEEGYLDILKKHNILPLKTDNIQENHLENLQDLVEILKFIKNRRKKMYKMVQIGNNDKNILLKKGNIDEPGKIDEDEHKFANHLDELFQGESDSEIESGFGPNKSFTRSFIKLIKLYSGDFTQIGDLTRMRIIRNDINSLINTVVEFITSAKNNKNITHIGIVDTTGEPISDPIKKSGYRDIKILFKLKSGNVVELQFQYKEMLEAKERGIYLDGEENSIIFDKLKKEEKLFSKAEMKELIEFARTTVTKLPKINILQKLLEVGNIKSLSYRIDPSIFSLSCVSTDFLYDISRQLSKGSILREKIIRLEKIISDHAWSKIVIKYLDDKGVNLGESEKV